MKIKVKQDMLVGDRSHKAGDWVETDDVRAKALVEAGHAEPLKEGLEVNDQHASVPAAEVKMHEANKDADKAVDYSASPMPKEEQLHVEYPEAEKSSKLEVHAESDKDKGKKKKVERADAKVADETATLKV